MVITPTIVKKFAFLGQHFSFPKHHHLWTGVKTPEIQIYLHEISYSVLKHVTDLFLFARQPYNRYRADIFDFQTSTGSRSKPGRTSQVSANKISTRAQKDAHRKLSETTLTNIPIHMHLLSIYAFPEIGLSLTHNLSNSQQCLLTSCSDRRSRLPDEADRGRV